jgi:hypothetical protein
MMKILRLHGAAWAYRALALFCMALIIAMPAARAETGDPNFERLMLKQYDYIFFCDIEVLDKFLNVKGVGMAGPYVRVKVSYQLTNAMNRRQGMGPGNVIKYEDLWFRNGKCVGMHRYEDIYLNPNYQGGIYIRGAGDSTVYEHNMEATNTAVRLTMDIYVKRSILAGIMIPYTCYEQISSDLGQWNFFILEEAINGRGENMSLHLMTYPRNSSSERYFYYDDTGRQ